MQQKNSQNRRPHKEDVKDLTNLNSIKEEPMAAKEFTTENPFNSYATQAQDAWKEMYNYQVKTSQFLMDQAMKWGQSYTDHTYTQWTETSKLAQDFMKSGMTLADELRKGFYTATEKMTKIS